MPFPTMVRHTEKGPRNASIHVIGDDVTQDQHGLDIY